MDKKQIFMLFAVLLILIAVFLVYKSQGLRRQYDAEVKSSMEQGGGVEKDILKEEDIKHLPEPVQKYLRYVGVIGKEKVYSVKAVFEGEMKLDPKKDWVQIQAEQYNFYDSQLTRMFYIKCKMNGLPVFGLHTYNDKTANMLIKVAGLVTVQDSKGEEMRISDTTTLLNDMCFLAPATLIDERIEWEKVDSLTARASFTNKGCRVTASLHFNDKGELINFISNDRYYTPLDGTVKKATWSTPISDYKERSGLRLPTYGEAVWKLPEGDYCYAKFNNIKEIKYNYKG